MQIAGSRGPKLCPGFGAQYKYTRMFLSREYSPTVARRSNSPLMREEKKKGEKKR
jgi:hypothetical protein